MAAFRLAGPNVALELDWFGTLVLAGLVFAIASLLLRRVASDTTPDKSEEMPVVGSGSADKPLPLALPLSPTPSR